jgi:hypothetical protein
VPDHGLHLIDVVEFVTSQPEVTYEYVHKAYIGYQIPYSVPLGDCRFRARSCVGGPFRYDITDHVIGRAQATTNPFRGKHSDPCSFSIGGCVSRAKPLSGRLDVSCCLCRAGSDVVPVCLVRLMYRRWSPRCRRPMAGCRRRTRS